MVITVIFVIAVVAVPAFAIAVVAVPAFVLEVLPRAGAGCGSGLASKSAYTVSRMFAETVARRTRLLDTEVVLLL